MSKWKGNYYVTGKSLGHTMSPDIYIRLGLNYGVKEFPTEEAFKEWVLKKEYSGFNVTIPYKQTVIPCLDCISAEAKEIGAVNTVVNKNGMLYGYNTDCYGLSKSLKECGISLKDKTVAVLGSGGASKCAVYVSKIEGAKSVKVCSRKGEYTYKNLYEDNDVEVIINTTPVGMFPNINEQIIDLEKLTEVKEIYDVVYNPLTTSLVLKARSLGLKCGNGLNMLVWQGIKAFELYTETIVQNTVAQSIILDIYNEKKNVVLIGMPSSGKSSVGKMLASELNKDFFDADDEFTKRFNLTPASAILTLGEGKFRDMESEVILSLSSKLGAVIATGGGAVIREENRANLKANGTVVFLDRDINLLSQDNRPLSKEKGVARLYNERESLYRGMADITVKIDDKTSISDVVKIIKKSIK